MSSPVSSSSKFFIQLPQDEYWNTGYPAAVIEAEEQPADKWGYVSLKVLAPASFANKWPTVSRDSFKECSGPAREFDVKSYIRFIHTFKPNIHLPKGWSKKELEELLEGTSQR